MFPITTFELLQFLLCLSYFYTFLKLKTIVVKLYIVLDKTLKGIGSV